jgi:acetylornithine deacetylase
MMQTCLEDRLVEEIRGGEEELVALVTELVGYDTVARQAGDPPREERALQTALATRLQQSGGHAELWEPDSTGTGNRLVPDDLSFEGRPQLVVRMPGTGGGRSLLLNGHIDVVPPGEGWTTDPFRAEVKDGFLLGRGVADMKGGVAALCFAIEALRRVGAKLKGDIVFCTVTDEETSGAGSLAAAAHGVAADAGICAEPSGFDAWVACRGTMWPYVVIPGRAAHAGMPQPHWSAGGGVNAINKAQSVLSAVTALGDDWRTRPDQQHPHVAPGSIVPTLIGGGEFSLTYPSSCRITFDVQYPPTMVTGGVAAHGVEAEIRDWVNAAAAADPWLRANPLSWGLLGETVAAEIADDHPLVELALASGAEMGRPGRPAGLDSWHDAAYFTSRADTPTFSYGPGGFETAHSAHERMSVAELVDYCAIVALTALRHCQ